MGPDSNCQTAESPGAAVQVQMESEPVSGGLSHDPTPKSSTTIGGRLRQVIENSSAAGVSHIASAKSRLARAFWSLLFFGGLIGLLVNLHSIIQRYRSGPVLVQTSSESERFQWPDISICNPSSPIPFTDTLRKQWESLQERESRLGNWKRNAGRKSKSLFLLSSINHQEFRTTDFSATAAFLQIRKEMKNLPTVAGTDSDVIAVKMENDMYFNRWFHDPGPSNCYTLNLTRIADKVNKRYPPTSSHDITDITIGLYLNVTNFLIFNGSFVRQINIIITPPDYSLYDAPVNRLAAGIEAMFEIRAKRTIHIFDEKKCTADKEQLLVYDATLTKFKSFYTGFYDCKYFFSQMRYVKNCGCYSSSLPIYAYSHIYDVRNKSFPLCLNMTLFNDTELEANVRCMKSIEISLENFTESVSKYCFNAERKPPCNNLIYQINKHEYRFPEEITDALYRKLKRLFNIRDYQNASKFMRQTLTYLRFRREQKVVKVIAEQLEYPLSNFISDFGGLAGLWMGLSVISLFELVETLLLFVALIAVKCWRCFRRTSSGDFLKHA